MDYDSASRTQTTSYADGSQSIIRHNMAGQIIEATGESGTISYTYDKAGLLETQTDEEGGETSYYTYDKTGRRTKLVSGNREISYNYGKNGELLHVGDNIQRLFVTYTYDSMMRETSRTFGNGVVQHTEYDAIGRTTFITEKSPTREILRAEGYIYDDKGRRTHSINELGQVTKYLYDAQGRLGTVFYPYSEEKADADKQEATEAGLFFSLDKGSPETLYLASAEHSAIRALLDEISFGRSSLLTVMQTVWKESYTYDANSNRLTKTTPWGTINYNYDSENRLVYSGVEGNGTAFSYDANGNLLNKQNAYKIEQYAYNGLNRMAQSVVTDNIEKSQTTSYYGYDAFGRRTLVQDEGFATMRTLYDGQSFDIIRESEVFAGGDFTTNYIQNGIQYSTGEATGGRYGYIAEEEGTTEGRYKNIDGYTTEHTRFTGTKVSLYAKGESVGVNRSASTGTASGRAYFGTDILGSVRSATTDGAAIEDRYEYDAFGTPYKGDFSNGLDNGYTGKPYDATTGLYNYGYRDYSPETARFTTVDPIRDGNNWFSYVVNDPVNYVDLWGLAASDPNKIVVFSAIDMNDSINNIAYNILVRDSYTEIKKAAKDTGQEIEVINGKDATNENFRKVLEDDSVSRLVVVAHGGPDGTLEGSDGNDLEFVDSDIPTVDIVACYASNGVNTIYSALNKASSPTIINTYNPIDGNGDGEVIWWNQTNEAIQEKIPNSIGTEIPTSGGVPTVVADPLTKWLSDKFL